LIKSGSARFAESTTRAPNNDPDAPRSIPSGMIFAETGKVTLLVGDDVATHQNSVIWAAQTIDVYGDAGDADPGYGTNIILRGNITAECTVSPAASGHPSGYPVGVCAPSTATHPTQLTQIWGSNDVDNFQLGDPSGLDLN